MAENKTGSYSKFAPYLSIRNATSPNFAPNGEGVFFLWDLGGTPQVWLVSLEGKKPQQVTFFDDRVTKLAVAPSGGYICVTIDRDGNENDQIYQVKPNTSSPVMPIPMIEALNIKHNLGVWRSDGKAIAFTSNRRHPAYFDVYVQEIGFEPVLVLEADATLYVQDWSPSGRYLLISQLRSNIDNNLLLLDLDNLQQEPHLLTPHPSVALYENPRFAVDETSIYLLTNQGREFMGLARLQIASPVIQPLVDPTWNIEHLEISPDRLHIAYATNVDGKHMLSTQALIEGCERNIPIPVGNVTGLSWSPCSSKLTFSFASPIHNPEIWFYDLESGKLSQITHSPKREIDFADFVFPTLVEFTSFDGLLIKALWYLPTRIKAKARLSVIIYVHGGPEGQSRFAWNPVIQFLVSHGYAVLAPNVRGSSGYGKFFMSLDDVNKRPDSVRDLKSAVEWLIEYGNVDAHKIAVYGSSYGGYLVLSAVTMFPKLWAAGISICGIANLLTFIQNTSSYRRSWRISEYGDPVKDRELLIEISPIHYVGRIQASMMIVHGARDPRVPVSEAEQLIENLLEQNHKVLYLKFEDEGHGIRKEANKLLCYSKLSQFLGACFGTFD